ncbi:MAG: MurR/RpiR family transcriptional regulator [Desulfarculaceae bacterium]|jgi:DNA-binding MurR/RpiR family transcriptional regulator
MPKRSKRKAAASGQIAPEVIQRIKQMMDEFTPRHRLLAEYMLQYPETVGFLSVSDLAKRAGVSVATVVRFCNQLGYEGYAHLGREIQQTIQAELSTLGRFKLSQGVPKLTDGHPVSSFERAVAQDMENLASMVKNVKASDFSQAVEWMAGADRVLIVGTMASASLAKYFGYMAAKILPMLKVVTASGAEYDSFLSELGPKSLVFLLAFPRYPRETLELGQATKRMGAKIVAITDAHYSPVVPLADIVFYVPIGGPALIDAYAAPVAFIRALVSELSGLNPKSTERALRRFEKFATDLDLFCRLADAWSEPEEDK